MPSPSQPSLFECVRLRYLLIVLLVALAVLVKGASAASQTITVSVPATASLYGLGNPTNPVVVPLAIPPNGQVQISAPGCVISRNTECIDANGGIYAGSNAANGLQVYGLLGEWSTSQQAPVNVVGPFFVGASNTLTAPSQGPGPYYLFLGINDLVVGDNFGAWTVTVTTNSCPVTLSFGPPFGIREPQSYMVASFTPSSGTVADYAKNCGYDHFDWQNQITHFPPAASPNKLGIWDTVEPRAPGPLIASGNVAYLGLLLPPLDLRCDSDWTGCSLMAPPTFFDPPEGSYTNVSYAPYPYYLPPDFVTTPGACPVPGYCPPLPYALSDDGKTLSFVDAPAAYQMSGEIPSTAPSGNFMAFSTALVGVDSQGAHTLPGGSWTWNSTFNGTAGGVSQTVIVNPIDPGSGAGGVTITSINGVPQTPPSVSCAATPNSLWPPNGKTVLVTVSGVITPGTSAIVPGGTTYVVTDEYGQDQPSGNISLASGGSYSFAVSLIAARDGHDIDGRTYTVVVNGTDIIGNVGSCSAVVTVPHDQGN